MLGEVWRRITARFASDRGEDETSDGHRFVPSPLDLSVRFAHGGSTSDVQRELADIEEQAREIERQRRRD